MKPGSQFTVLEVLKEVEVDRLSVTVVCDIGPSSVVVALVKKVTVAASRQLHAHTAASGHCTASGPNARREDVPAEKPEHTCALLAPKSTAKHSSSAERPMAQVTKGC